LNDTQFVDANGARIPRIGLGTWQSTEATCELAVLAALQAGYRHIDTAVRYGNDAAVGNALRASGLKRSDYFVTTKVWPDDLQSDDLVRSAAQSVDRLKLDAADLVLIHWPNAQVPLRESIDALCRLRRKGIAKHIGVANFPVGLLRQAVALASEPIVANQCEYHPWLDQTPVLAACIELDVAFVAYSPLGSGKGLLEDPTVVAIAEVHQKTSSQVLLRWCIQQEGVCAVPKSSNPERIAQNIDVFDFSLTPDEMDRLRALRKSTGRLINPPWAPAWDVPNSK
jgi:diketogulonate reductase-like aldo/keto reductase